MDKKCEEVVVKNFFIKNLHERVIYELSSSKKRKDALNRLCHDFKRTINEECMIEVPKNKSDYGEIVNVLKNLGTQDNCYAVSFNKEIDGKYLALTSALAGAVGFGMPSIILCIPNELAYFESEQEYGAPARYILKKKNKL